MYMNEAQKQAVWHKNGPMLVLAGPGSGKTLVITERTKHLIEEEGIPEKQILVITFTRAAALQMKERFLSIRGINHTGVNFGTFHSIFFAILKRAYNLNAGNIAQEEICNQFMKDIIQRLGLEYDSEKEYIADLLMEISLVKGSRIDLKNYYSINCADETFHKVYQEYQCRLKAAGLIDFDDILLFTYELLSQRHDILIQWQKKFRYILIDEFQDINMLQYDIVRMLAKPCNNLFIVGDDDQSIYRFRGARPEIMLNFPKDYPECKKVSLETNYRSASVIIKAAGKLMLHNRYRFKKEIVAAKKSQGALHIAEFDTLSKQNQSLSDEILRLNHEGIPLSDMAILIRTNMGAGSLLHKLMEYNIPFRIRDNLPNLFDHWIASDLTAYMKIAAGAADRSLYLQIINRPKRYVGRDCFERQEVDFEELMSFYEDKNWMLERLEQLQYDLGVLADLNPYAAVNYIRKGIGYEDYLKEYAEARRLREDELLDILDELQESTRGYHTFAEWLLSMEEYRNELKRQSEEKRTSPKDSVMIATMHSSKGLEFNTVFIIDANEGITPHKKAVLDADIEEERRLFYVAMTRAKELLYIYSTKEHYNKSMQPSRFLEEIREEKPKLAVKRYEKTTDNTIPADTVSRY